jgi:hypothetical protein
MVYSDTKPLIQPIVNPQTNHAFSVRAHSTKVADPQLDNDLFQAQVGALDPGG